MPSSTDPLDQKFVMELTGRQCAVLMALLSIHNKNPVMSSKDTDVLVGLAASVDRQLDRAAISDILT